MQEVERYCRQFGLEDYAEKQPIFQKLSATLKVRPGVAFAGVILLSIILLFVPFVNAFVIGVFTFVFPAYKSFKALESEDEKDDKRWLTYWIVFGFFHCFDNLIGAALFFVPLPFLGVLKTLALTFLHISKDKGASYLFDYAISPAFTLIAAHADPYVRWFEINVLRQKEQETRK